MSNQNNNPPQKAPVIKNRLFDDLLIRTPSEYVLMFRERWYYGILPAILLVFFYVYSEYKKPGMYRTQVSIQFQTNVDRTTSQYSQVNPIISGVELNNHIEQIKSQQYFEYFSTFLSDAEVEKIRKAYRDPDEPGKTPGLSSIIRSGLTVRVRADTTIVQIGMTHRDPQMAKFVADRFAAKYIDYHLDISQTNVGSAILFLQRQEGNLQRQYQESQNALREYRAKYSMAKLGDNKNVFNQRHDSLSNALIQAELELLRISNEQEKVDAYLESGEDLLVLPFFASYGSIQSLQTRMDSISHEREILGERYFENHPKMKSNQLILNTVQSEIDAKVKEAINDLAIRLTLAIETEAHFDDEKEMAEQKLLELDEIEVNYGLLQNQAKTVQGNLAKIQTQLSQAIISSHMDITNIKPLDKAYVPWEAYEPNVKKALIEALVLGFMVTVFIPILIGIFDSRLKAAWEVEDFLNTHILAEIPKVKGVKIPERPHVVMKSLDQGVVECFHGLYSQYEISSKGKNDPQTILITSTLPNEGKSFLANNLASTFANHGKRILLIDMDFRRPSLHAYNKVSNRTGVLKWLKKENVNYNELKEDTDLGIQTVAPNFDLLTTGGMTRKPTQIFIQERLKELFSSLKKCYDIVIMDAPPVGLFPDALLLTEFTDQTYYVCRFNKTSKFKIRHFIERINETPTILSGIILNGIPRGASSNYYSYFGYGSYPDNEYSNYYKSKTKKRKSAKKKKTDTLLKTS